MRTAVHHDTTLGPMLLVAEDDRLLGAWFLGQKHFPAATPTPGAEPPEDVCLRAAAQLDAYLAGRSRHFDIALDPRGTPFQKAVWQALRAIPYGETTTYGELARLLGRPSGARAVGAAVGRNPLSILIPCHRVIGASGGLTGYAGGLDRKKALLALEQATRRT